LQQKTAIEQQSRCHKALMRHPEASVFPKDVENDVGAGLLSRPQLLQVGISSANQPHRDAANLSFSQLGEKPGRTPGYSRAASGQAAAAPPRRVMNSASLHVVTRDLLLPKVTTSNPRTEAGSLLLGVVY
jgi:hypothetical protein